MAAPHDTRVVETEPATERVVTTDRPETYQRDRVVDRTGWTPTFGPGMVIGALGFLGVLVSLFTNWFDNVGAKPDGIPVAFLGDNTTTSSSPSMLIVLIPLAVVLLAGAFLPMGTPLRLLGGIATLVVVAVFAFQVNDSLGDGGDLGSALGTGWYAAAIGGFLALIAGAVPDAWTGRREREVIHESDGY